MNTTNNKIIRKANELVESRYRFDIWETRVLAKMITLIDKSDADFQNYRIYLKDIQKEFGLEKNKDAYTRLKEGARRLMSRIVKISFNSEEGEKVLETPVIVGLETMVERKSFIDVTFHPNMRPFLLQLKSKFLMYDIKNILRIPSVYSIRIYELLKQYEKIGQRSFRVTELKEILAIENQYKLYGHFKKRIILKAQEDLKSHTDIKFTFEEYKKGRAVDKIKFLITKNNPDGEAVDDTPSTTTISNKTKSNRVEQVYTLVAAWGITKKTVESYVAKYDEEYILKRIKYVERQIETKRKNGKSIDNIGGYFNVLMEKEEWVDPIQEKKKRATHQRKKKSEVLQKRKLLKEEERRLKTEMHNKEIEIIDALFESDPGTKRKAIALAKEKSFSSFDRNKSDEENLADNFLFRVSAYGKAKELYHEHFTELHQLYQPEIDRITKALTEL